MEHYYSFLESVEKAANIFKKSYQEPVRVITHLDTDGLTSAAIISKTLKREGIRFVLSTVRQLDLKILKELSRESYKTFIFIDLGSGYLTKIKKYLGNKTVFILDHHEIDECKCDVIHVNPHIHGVDGGSEVSGAGVAYFFSRALNKKNIDLAHIALVGAVGDMQEKKGFGGMNSFILEDAVSAKTLDVQKGLTMFGSQTRPLHKLLEYCTTPYIPGVTGDPEGTKQFLNELGIPLRAEGGKFKFRKLVNLSEEEMKRLVTGVILKRLGSEEDPEDVLGPVYLVKGERDESPTRDLREFSTLLNATGRMYQPSLGIGTCLGDANIRKSAINLSMSYKKEIIKALNWFHKNRKTEKVLERKGYVLINVEDQIRDTLVGTLATILSKSNVYPDNTIIVSMVHLITGETKASLRICGYKPTKDIDLRDIVSEACKELDGAAGGHKQAAGCLISQEKEPIFVRNLLKILEKQTIEDTVK